MILYEKSSVRIAEVHFDATGAPQDADVVRYQWQFRPVPGTHSFVSHTVCLDLTQEPETLLKRMRKQTRYEIRRAEKENLSIDIDDRPSSEKLRQYYTYFDAFATKKGIPVANRARLESMRLSGQLVLSRALDETGQTLVWQSALRTPTRLRSLTAASIRHTGDGNLVGRANRYLHWREINRFRELGIETYDLGGWYVGDADEEKLSINLFKEGFAGEVRELHNTYDGRTWKGRMAVRLHQWRKGE